MSSCEKCMETNTLQTRQMLGCGWAPIPAENLRPFVSAPSPLKFQPATGRDGERVVDVCPGYLVALPEVVEIAEARVHWEKGHLVEFCEGQPSASLMRGVVILSGAVSELTNAAARPADQGGIGAG
jgi:hypothetical protein